MELTRFSYGIFHSAVRLAIICKIQQFLPRNDWIVYRVDIDREAAPAKDLIPLYRRCLQHPFSGTSDISFSPGTFSTCKTILFPSIVKYYNIWVLLHDANMYGWCFLHICEMVAKIFIIWGLRSSIFLPRGQCTNIFRPFCTGEADNFRGSHSWGRSSSFWRRTCLQLALCNTPLKTFQVAFRVPVNRSPSYGSNQYFLTAIRSNIGTKNSWMLDCSYASVFKCSF